MTLLQEEWLASQQAITARSTNVENIRAHLQLHQRQQAQPAKPPQQAALQLVGGTHSMAFATKNELQPATITAGVKTNANKAADLWRANEGPKLFIARGGFNVSERLNIGLVAIVLDFVTNVSDAMSKHLNTMSELAGDDFFLPVAMGEMPRAMPAEIQCSTFVDALMENLEYAMNGAPLVCKQRVVRLRSKLEKVWKIVKVHVRRHFNTPAEHSGEGSTAAAVKHEHRPVRRCESACGAGRRDLQEAHVLLPIEFFSVYQSSYPGIPWHDKCVHWRVLSSTN